MSHAAQGTHLPLSSGCGMGSPQTGCMALSATAAGKGDANLTALSQRVCHLPRAKPVSMWIRRGWCGINQVAGFEVFSPWLRAREGVWPHVPTPFAWSSPEALSPHLEVIEVCPEADPAHVLQEHIQRVPCLAFHMQLRLTVPLQRPLILLQP